MKKRNLHVLIALLLFFVYAICVDIGSDTTVNRFDVQQTINDGDRVAGFASLDAGFIIANANARGTFDSFFQVSGDLEFDAGALILNQDLVLHNNANIATLGDIIAQGHMLELHCSATSVPSSDASSALCKVALVEQQTTNEGRPILTLDWSVSDTLLAVGMSITGGSTNSVEIWEWNGQDTLTFLNGTNPNGKNVQTVRWHPMNNWLAVGTQNGTEEVYIYAVDWSTGALTLLDSQGVGGNGGARSVAWHPSGNYLAVGTSSNTQELQLYEINSDGTFGASIILNLNNIDVAENDGLAWNTAGDYLAVALEQANPNPELLVYELGTAPLSLTLVASVAKGTSTRAVDWSPVNPTVLAVGFEGNISITTELYHFDAGAGTLTLVAQIPNIDKTTQALDWAPTTSCLAIGTSAPNTNEFRVYDFDNNTSEVTAVSEYDYGSDQVNGVRWSRTTFSLATGGDDTIIYIYRSVLVPGNPDDPNGPGVVDRCFNWSNICVKMNSDITLNERCLLFSGQSCIDGRGHSLTLTENSRIFLDTGASLCMENLTIKGLKNNIIGAFDDSGTFSLSNAEWVLDGDYTFTKGRFDVIADFKVSGEGHTFAYQSEAVSKVQECGSMTLDYGLTFSYDPVTADRDLLQLTNDTSELILHGATLHSTTTGLQLTTGKLIVERKSFITSEATVEAEGISFGDGASSSNNLNVQFPGLLEVASGCVVYNDA